MNLIYASLVVLAMTFANLHGWFDAHSTVARECERLGSFYVGDVVYVCSPKEQT